MVTRIKDGSLSGDNELRNVPTSGECNLDVTIVWKNHENRENANHVLNIYIFLKFIVIRRTF